MKETNTGVFEVKYLRCSLRFGKKTEGIYGNVDFVGFQASFFKINIFIIRYHLQFSLVD